MEKKELQNLAQKIQLEIKEEELPTYLETFNQLEELLTNFKKVKIGKRVKSIKRANAGYLTLSDLEKISKKYSCPRISKRDLKNNAETTPDGFILFQKK